MPSRKRVLTVQSHQHERAGDVRRTWKWRRQVGFQVVWCAAHGVSLLWRFWDINHVLVQRAFRRVWCRCWTTLQHTIYGHCQIESNQSSGTDGRKSSENSSTIQERTNGQSSANVTWTGFPLQLTFDGANHLKCDQELLLQCDSNSDREYKLKTAQFNGALHDFPSFSDTFFTGISHLCIFVANNVSGSDDTPTRIHYIGLRGEFSDKDNRQKVVLATYEARSMPDDIRSAYLSWMIVENTLQTSYQAMRHGMTCVDCAQSGTYSAPNAFRCCVSAVCSEHSVNSSLSIQLEILSAPLPASALRHFHCNL